MTNREKGLEIAKSFYGIDPQLEEYRTLKRWAASLRESAVRLSEHLDVEELLYGGDGHFGLYPALEAAVLWWEERNREARPARAEERFRFFESFRAGDL